ncbi:NfeD family protein [Lacrimispora indolis]|uniref:NfeD family protein n=1 Tax=Lacrimispora indolis TaxID=69825 RepID=UPI00045E6A02|nr:MULTISPECIES: NfeD family protein [Lachnospiraceae]MBE7720967.1 NfeD family protein [Lacrimispora celerecrescens]
MAAVYWLIAFVVLLGIEAMTMALTTIWFAGGALVAFVLALFGINIQVQLAVFVIVSFVLLFFTRPFALKYVNRNTVKTNMDSLIGKSARVTATINNTEGKGAAVLNGQEWTARALEDDRIYPVGTMVEVKEIRGVKLIVSENQEEA